MKNTRLYIGALTAALVLSMSGCTVSISLGTNKNAKTEQKTTVQEAESEKKTEENAETEKEPPTPVPTSTSTPIPEQKQPETEQVNTQSAAQAEPQNTTQYVSYYVVNCKQSITLRTSPSTEAAEICQIPLGSAVSYISTASNGFYYISYNGNTGYALASYLSSSSGDSYYETCRVVNCRQSITLRPKPDVDSGEICQIPLGATVSFVGTASNGFYEIYYMGNHGYSLAEYLEFQ